MKSPEMSWKGCVENTTGVAIFKTWHTELNIELQSFSDATKLHKVMQEAFVDGYLNCVKKYEAKLNDCIKSVVRDMITSDIEMT